MIFGMRRPKNPEMRIQTATSALWRFHTLTERGLGNPRRSPQGHPQTEQETSPGPLPDAPAGPIDTTLMTIATTHRACPEIGHPARPHAAALVPARLGRS